MSHLDLLIDAPGPKKLLAIDGGGIRGLIAIEFLCKIEALLRERFDRPQLVLSEYFDYVAGTSTGAIIATLISLGYSTEAIRRFYRTGAHTMFDPNFLQRIARRTKGPLAIVMGIAGMLVYKAIYTSVPLERQIKEVLDDPLPGGAAPEHERPLTTLGTEKLRTLLMIVTRNASTDSPWPLSNNPRAKYNLRADPAGATNLDIPLWELIRASTAAPVFFKPKEIHVPGVAKPFVFLDGGITVYNNPAFQLFLMATLPTYNLGWPAGQSQLLLISVGTGLCDSEDLKLGEREMNLLYNVQSTPAALMRATTVEQDILCRVFGKLRGDCGIDAIDSEIGDLIDNRVPLAEKLFTYARYNVELSARGLKKLQIEGVDPKLLQPLDSVDHLDELERVGKTAAQRCVDIGDFEGFLDRSALRPSVHAPPLPQEPLASVTA
ncbi:MAG TPA: patatin-like phospholipase family protein [Candidatus Baltobacteraceae bacterium]|nr:patatin-like phospholipase family protein [Candidatus Baltobacteraceae bacterium]